MPEMSLSKRGFSINSGRCRTTPPGSQNTAPRLSAGSCPGCALGFLIFQRRNGKRSLPDLNGTLARGRVAVEKNLPAFLELKVPGEKVVVGDGPARTQLEARYPEVRFLGYRYGAELAAIYGDADVFVFPSKTDTFGLVMLEALATGTPVAAYPVTGPIDIVEDGVTGGLHADLAEAVTRALACGRGACRRYAEAQGWDQIAERFLADLVPVPAARASSVGV